MRDADPTWVKKRLYVDPAAPPQHWEPIGPSNFAGRVTALAFHPADQTLFVGVWRSHDFGKTCCGNLDSLDNGESWHLLAMAGSPGARRTSSTRSAEANLAFRRTLVRWPTPWPASFVVPRNFSLRTFLTWPLLAELTTSWNGHANQVVSQAIHTGDMIL
jgi:hypothetical protein